MKSIVFINTNKSGSSRDAIKAADSLGYYVTDFFRCPSLDCKTCRGWLTYCAVR